MKCKYCHKELKHVHGKIYHDDSIVFPQYCPNDFVVLHPSTTLYDGGQLHVPEDTCASRVER